MNNVKKPLIWTQAYPYGTKEGDEEAKFFRALARHAKFEYRSVGALVKDSGLTRERVEEIIDKYVNNFNPPLVYAHPDNEDHWGYWERCPDRLQSDKRNISQKDQDKRINKHLGDGAAHQTIDNVDDKTQSN